MSWVITNRNDITFPGPFQELRFPTYRAYIDKAIPRRTGSGPVIIFIDGYCLPRQEWFRSHGHLTQLEMVAELYSEHGSDFINRIKGYFTLVILKQDGFEVYTDHLGLKKSFYWNDGKQFIVSDCFISIREKIWCGISRKAIVAHVLFNHYVGNETLAEGIRFNDLAQKTTWGENGYAVNQYWQVDELINREERAGSYLSLAESFEDIIRSYISFFKIKKPSTAVTGGLDSRTILAALLALGLQPHTYTYGHPRSADVLYGKSAAAALSLPYAHYYQEHPTAGWYTGLVGEIWRNGQGLTSLHRAHRLDAVQQEAEHCDAMFFGYLGGEMVRGLWPDDLIVSAFVRTAWAKGQVLDSLIRQIFTDNLFLYTDDDIHLARALVEEQGLLARECYFHYLLKTMAHLHFAQDLNVFEKYGMVIPVFFDIDYLSLLFASTYNLRYKSNMRTSIFRRLSAPEYNSRLIQALHPALARLPLSKNYTPAGYVRNRYVSWLVKFAKDRLAAQDSVANFSYGPWFKEFLHGQLAGDFSYRNYFSEIKDRITTMKMTTEKDCFPSARIIEINHWLGVLQRTPS